VNTQARRSESRSRENNKFSLSEEQNCTESSLNLGGSNTDIKDNKSQVSIKPTKKRSHRDPSSSDSSSNSSFSSSSSDNSYSDTNDSLEEARRKSRRRKDLRNIIINIIK
jgi:hypothetical protein